MRKECSIKHWLKTQKVEGIIVLKQSKCPKIYEKICKNYD